MATPTQANVFVIDFDDVFEDVMDFIAGEFQDREQRRDATFNPDQEIVTWPIIAETIRHGDIVQVDRENPFFFFYNQQTDRLVPAFETEEIPHIVPKVFSVPGEFPPRYWYDANNTIEHVQIRPLGEQLGPIDASRIYLSAPYEQLTGQPGQSMMIPFAANNIVYYIVDDNDLEGGTTGTDPNVFLDNVLRGTIIHIIVDTIFGVDPDKILSVQSV
jgi:hypothetical protein